MSKLVTAISLLRKNRLAFLCSVFTYIRRRGLTKWMSDKLYIETFYKLQTGYCVDLKCPKTFNEKIQWLKLYDYSPNYDSLVDKANVKTYVKDTIGEEYIIPTYGIWSNVDDIDWTMLPDKFVIKTTHGSGGQDVCICKDKKYFNRDKAVAKLKKSMLKNTYWYGREKPYKNLEPKVMAEMLLGDGNQDVPDYKFMCFNGKVKCLFVCTNRRSKSGLNVTFFDTCWKRLPFERNHPADPNEIPKPKSFDLMISLSEQLSKNLKFSRIDFYEYNGKPYFGEITLYPGSGYESFSPEEWDLTLGNWINLK